VGGALGFTGGLEMSKPGDGSAAGRWPDFAERDLFAHVAHRCYLDFQNGKAVSVDRVLRELATRGFPLRRMDYEPRSKVEAALAARKAGDVLALVNAIKAGVIRRRRRPYLTKSVSPLRDAFYRVLARLEAERPQTSNYGRKCLASIRALTVRFDKSDPTKVHSDDDLAGRVLAFMLSRPDQAEE
jgi:hypothetical protein